MIPEFGTKENKWNEMAGDVFSDDLKCNEIRVMAIN